ncbi:L-alanine-DL-glutamate epimerase-like enolase superfamily enzyme [Sphingopyxis panaciterrae]|uniref:dipeptide epimerase n=1 Tax=Sphingopyxis panaciterrae TaxID=363841 RepID=UPI001424039A|nr:dipeptide epimerase [Sphingopyxis panaciterrae]NIJ35910.1 L-alanine-DL-glutamate epimerase-like enolase superfamily enzyme [Sphingopyxis panaciterrae]
MARLKLGVSVEKLKLAAPFRIASRTFDSADAIVVTLDDGSHVGRGEATGVYYLGDDLAHMLAALEQAHDAIEDGPSREELRSILPAGGARNAVDAALWELESKRSGLPVWALAGLAAPRPLRTTFTVGADEPARMAEAARAYAHARSIKIKLTGDLDLDIARVSAIRAARPDVWIGVDANQGFAIGDLDALVAAMVAADVALIEQPLARGREADLDGYRSPIPLAADESALTLDDVPALNGRFDVFNIKLDKCGGLTEALMIAEAARKADLGVMVGCMVSSSLGIAPGFVVGQHCDIVDLDGPLFLAQDRAPGLVYRDGTIWCDEAVWGARTAVAA